MATITALADGMGKILLTWSLFGAIFLGVGTLAYHIIGGAIRRTEDIFMSFWIGWAAIILYLQIWHLFLRIDMWVLILPAIAGAYGWYTSGRALSTIVRGNVARHHIATLLLGVVVLWTANHALTPLYEYDAGLYHLPTVRWENTYPIVAGLGNLSWVLAYNTSAFLYMAMLNVGPWAGHSFVFADSLLLVVFLLQLTVSAVRVCRRDRDKDARPAPSDMILALLIIPTVTYTLTMGSGVASMNYDIIVFMFQVLVSTQLLTMLTARQQSSKEAGTRLLTVTLLAVTGIAVKITFAVLGGLAVVIALAVFARIWRRTRTPDRRTILLLPGIALLSMGPWLIRSVILSGYPAFPAALFALPVDWKMPLQAVRADDALVIGWARIPGPDWQQSLGNWHWLQRWFASTHQSYLLPLLIAIATGALACVAARHGKSHPAAAWLALVPAAISVPVWFATAPDPRYASAIFWLLAVGTVALTFRNVASPARLTIVATMALLAVIQQPAAAHYALTAFSGGPDGGLYGLPGAPLKRITLPSGTRIYEPAQGDQAWDAPLPSAPPAYVLPQLRRRCATTLLCGFRVDQPEAG